MGQHQNKPAINQQYFHNLYEENLSHQYFTSTKGFGYRKTNIKTPIRGKISAIVSNSFNNIDDYKASQKMIRKKQFQSTAYPFSCIGLLIVQFQTRCIYATGCLIGPNLVLTAASNISHKETESHPVSIHFVLGIDSSEGDVYVIKKDINVPEKYIQQSNGSHRYNYAVLEIERRFGQKQQTQEQSLIQKDFDYRDSPGLVYGYLGINTRFSGLENIYIYGYSMEIGQNNNIGFKIRGEKLDKLMCKDGSISYKMESNQSQCGSPILIRRNEYYHIVGIHICGKKDLGTGLQFDETMRKTINSWVSVPEGRLNLSGKELDTKAFSLLTNYDWRNLVILNVDNNHLMLAGLLVLTKITWPVLRELHACNNEIVKLQFQTSTLKNLQVLYLTKNQIKQVLIIEELAILRVLELSENRIESIDELVHLKYLQRLYLNGNKLTKIPAEIEKWSQLKKLELSRNELEQIPNEIVKLKNLTAISLDGNRSKFDEIGLIKRLQGNNVEVILN